MVTKDEVRPVSIDTLGPQNANLFLIEDIEDAGRTKSLAQSYLTALRAVADWTKSFVIRPHKDLGRPGPVCPFTPVAIEHKALWLAAERSAGRSKPEVIGLIKGYQRLLLSNPPCRRRRRHEDWFKLWARRYGSSAVEALADELRRLPWNARRI